MLSVGQTAAEIALHEAGDPQHGYSQPNRAGIGTGGGVGEWVTVSDGRSYGISPGDRDCASLAIECYAAQGVDCGGAWYTLDMREKMLASGNFMALPASTWRNPEPGDILLTERNRHAAVAVGGGRLVEALRSESHSTHGALGDQDGGEIWVRDLYDDGWDVVLRYCGPEREGVNETGQTVAGAGRYIVVSPDGLNVRAEPSTSAEIVAQYSTGDTVNLDGWTTTGDGWVWGRYVGASSGKHRYVAIGHPGDNSLLAPSGGSIVVGSKVKVTNPYDEHGTRLAVSGTYDVVQVDGSRVVIARDGVVIAALDASSLAIA